MSALAKRFLSLFLLPMAIGAGLFMGLLALLTHPWKLLRLFRRETWAELRPRDQERKVLVQVATLLAGLALAAALVYGILYGFHTLF
jgi:hypothetical protein